MPIIIVIIVVTAEHRVRAELASFGNTLYHRKGAEDGTLSNGLADNIWGAIIVVVSIAVAVAIAIAVVIVVITRTTERRDACAVHVDTLRTRWDIEGENTQVRYRGIRKGSDRVHTISDLHIRFISVILQRQLSHISQTLSAISCVAGCRDHKAEENRVGFVQTLDREKVVSIGDRIDLIINYSRRIKRI